MESSRDEVYSRRVRAGKRTYYIDVRSTRSGNDFYLTITESKRGGEEEREKFKIFLYKEDFEKFREAFNQALDFVYGELGKINALPRSHVRDDYHRDEYPRDASRGDAGRNEGWRREGGADDRRADDRRSDDRRADAPHADDRRTNDRRADDRYPGVRRDDGPDHDSPSREETRRGDDLSPGFGSSDYEVRED